MKNTIKKIGLLFAVVIMAVLCTVSVSAEETTYTEGYYTYTVTDGEATIVDVDESGWDRSEKVDLIIPDTLNGYPVTTIGDLAIMYIYNLNNVTIPASVTSANGLFIGGMVNIFVDEANMYYSSEDGVLFNKDKNILITYPCLNERKSYKVPDGVTKIGDAAFWRNEHIETLILPTSVCGLGNGFFTEGWSLTKLIVENNKCIFPNSDLQLHPDVCLTIHGYENSTAQTYAEEYNYEFVALECEHSSYEYKLVEANGCNNAYEYYECTTCGDIKNKKVFPDTATHTYNKVVTPPTCTTQGYTTYTCECKDSYVADYVNAKGHNDADFDGYCNVCGTYCAYSDKHYQYTVINDMAIIIRADNEIRGEVVIPSTLGGYPLIEIGRYAFAENINIKSVVIPDGVTKISECAFDYCLKLESITLPDSLKTVEVGAFYSCISLKEIVVPKNVTSIGYAAFVNCHSLRKLVIKNSKATIGEYITYTDISPKNISSADWVKKFLLAFEAASNESENAEELYMDFIQHTEEHSDELRILPELTIYGNSSSTAKTYTDSNGTKFKTLEDYEEENHICTFGEWYIVTEATVFAEGEKRRDCECGEYETESIEKLVSAVTKDETTKVEITYTDDNFNKAVEVVVSEEAINANIAFEDEYENYKSYNISLLLDGQTVQPNGKVIVKLPVPSTFNAETIAVYYVDNNSNRTKLDSKVENGFVVFETDHFSEYVIVDENSKVEKNEDIGTSKPCSCKCHLGGIKAFFFKLINFFAKLFNPAKRVCACGVKH